MQGVKFSLINQLLTKKNISGLIDAVYRNCGQKETVIFCDRIMALGFHHAFKAGISFGKDDMLIPETKEAHGRRERESEVREYEQQYQRRPDHAAREIQQGGRRLGAVHRPDRERDDGPYLGRSSRTRPGRELPINSIYMMSHSGARGSPAQMKQLAGMRGLMAKPSGEIIETPIISNFKEGLTVLEYFNSTHGARKGLADTALQDRELGLSDAPSGRRRTGCRSLPRRDCGTEAGINVQRDRRCRPSDSVAGARVLGRTAPEDINDPVTGRSSCRNGR